MKYMVDTWLADIYPASFTTFVKDQDNTYNTQLNCSAVRLFSFLDFQTDTKKYESRYSPMTAQMQKPYVAIFVSLSAA